MQGPRPPQTWTGHGHGPAEAYGPLQPGLSYEVCRAFVDHDGADHPVGERWIYLGCNFLPCEDGLSLFVSLDGANEWHIRMRDRPEAEGPILRAFESHMVESPPPIARAPGALPSITPAPAEAPLGARLRASVTQLLRHVRPALARPSQRDALRALLPLGSRAATVQDVLGPPTGRLDLFSDGPATTTWLYQPAVVGPQRTRIALACDFDADDRLLAVRWL